MEPRTDTHPPSLGFFWLILAFGLIGFAHTPAPAGQILAEGGELVAAYREGVLHVRVPYDAVREGPSTLEVEVLDIKDRRLAHRSRTLPAGGGRGVWSMSLPIGRNAPLEDLAWDRLKIHDGRHSKIVSISEILHLPAVRVFAQRSYAAGSHASARIIASDSRTGDPLRASAVRLELFDRERATSLYAGTTDSLGTVQARFHLPEGSFGPRTLRVTAVTPLGTATADEPVRLERRDRILLTTDKPIYQPGQTMHLRALALDGASRRAAGEQPITLEVEDAKGNKVFRHRSHTDRFGIASGELELADEVNFGAYHVRAILGEEPAVTTQEKTVTVDRYTLPKFKVEVGLEGKAGGEATYYAPGDMVSGKLTARYMFGKPVSSAEVAVTLSTFDVEPVELARITGTTDAEGRYSFTAKLPDFLAGRFTEHGSATVAIEAEVKDTAAHTESRSRSLLVSTKPILIMAVPESGQLIPGMENRVFILTSYPDGTPAETTVSGNITPASIGTDASGVGMVTVLAGRLPMSLNLRATDARGRTAHERVVLETRGQSQSLRLRSDRSVYKVGDTLRLETLSTRPRGAVYLDVVKDGQTLITRAIESSHGRGAIDLDLTPDMFGALEVRAYQITSEAEPISDRRLIYVDPADDLEVEVSAARDTYRPGEEARIDFRVSDAAGRPVAAALGVEVVDEAVFALSDKHPGFEKVFLYLQKELLTPRYEIHQLSLEQVLRNDSEGPAPARIAERERSAQVLFAAAGSIQDADVHREFGSAAIEAKREAFQAAYSRRVVTSVKALAAALTVRYRTRPASNEGFDRDLQALYASHAADAKLLDPWGRPLVGTGTIGAAEYETVTLRSLGPDGRDGTADDIGVPVYASRRGSGAPRSTPFKGSVIAVLDAVAGGRSEIRGLVRDPVGRPLVSIKVSAVSRSSGRMTQMYTDPMGRFTIPDLAPDIYDVTFEGEAHLATRYQWLILDSGTRASITVALEPWKGATPVLSVYGPPEDDDNEGVFGDARGAFGHPVGGVAGGVIGGLPADIVGRAFATHLDLAAGVNDAAGDGNANLHGTRGRDFKLEVDGVSPVDPLARRFMSDVMPDAIDGGAGGSAPRIRSFFPETLYVNPAIVTDGAGRASIRVPMADSITTWRVSSLASTENGALGSSTAPIHVFQDFFIDLDLPAAVTKNDLLSVPVAVYNYLPDAQRVSLELRQDPWFALDNDVAVKQVDVRAGEVGVVYFRMRASGIGEQQLQVTARIERGRPGSAGDTVARPVEVRPDGEERAVVVNGRLEREATQRIVIPANALPDASKLFVKLYPGALSQVVEGLDAILRMPSGCFEQTSSSTYPDVLVLDYLKASKQLTPEIRMKAEQYVSLGYQRLVTFEVPGGGFSWFGQAPANKILTAYGLMEFADMSHVHEVDPRVIERTQRWLVSQQLRDGSFGPDASFINEGATSRYNADVVRITAYIGWALAATGYRGEAVEMARTYVAAHVTGKEDAYTSAVIANFAAELGGEKAWTDAAIDGLAAKATEGPKTAFWKQDGETPTFAREESADLETTALAAQALLKSGRRSALAKKALDYLAGKKDSFGNWSTTQATILSLKALLMSFSKGQSAETAGSVEVSVDGKTASRVEITQENNDLLRLIDLKSHTHGGEHTIGLAFAGKGSVQYQIVGRYYVPWALRTDENPREPLSIDVAYDRTRLAQDETATARVRVRNNTSETAKLIMVDLGIPPGFEPSAEDFASLVDRTRGSAGGKLEKFTITATQALLYFDGLNAGQTVELSYGLRAKFPVRAKTFSSRIYEYYNPGVEDLTKPVELTVVAK